MSEVLPGLPIGPPEDRQTRPKPPVALMVAAVIVGLEVVTEIVYLIGRDDLTRVARIVLVVVVGAQVLVVWGVLQLRPGAALCLFAVELATGLGVLANSDLDAVVRAGLGAAAVVVVVLVAFSLRAFPSPTIRIEP